MASKDLTTTLLERYIASMVLSGVGDAIGYKNGSWGLCNSGGKIYVEVSNLGGIENINVNKVDWMVSDDTVLHIATAKALVDGTCQGDKQKLYIQLAMNYKEGMKDMDGRKPGLTCQNSCKQLSPQNLRVPFNRRGGGCGATTRAMCIGLRYPNPSDIDELVVVSIESGRMTHHHPTGYLGTLATALFVAYSIQGKPLNEWGAGLMETLEKAKVHIKRTGVAVEENMKEWGFFTEAWDIYLKKRQLPTSVYETAKGPKFPYNFGFDERDAFYKSLSYEGYGGASGHDATIIAYDALLGSGLDWGKLCRRAMFHGGNSDGTGAIAAACYGAMKGFEGVPENNYRELEYKDLLERLGRDLYRLATNSRIPRPTFDVQQLPEKWICIFFLEDECFYDNRCSNEHLGLPYQWMFQKTKDEDWRKFNQNKDVEMMYCDPANSGCNVDIGGGTVINIDFTNLTATGVYKIRRLSTRSRIEFTRHIHATVWHWYWKDKTGKWVEYGESDESSGTTSSITSDAIEEMYLARPGGRMAFETQPGHKYMLDFREMFQENTRFKTRREVVRRPEFFDESSLRQRKQSDLMHTGDEQDRPPSTWKNIPGDFFHHRTVVQLIKDQSPREFTDVRNLFYQSMSRNFRITSIERIENGCLWSTYLSTRKRMTKSSRSGNVKELQLFHGTKNAENCTPICYQGFDFRLSGTATGTLYGKGVYFATTAEVSNRFTQANPDRCLFVVRVLVGEYTVGKPGYVRPPQKDPSDKYSDLYDSCVEKLDNPQYFIIFENGQTYPEYLIKYRDT